MGLPISLARRLFGKWGEGGRERGRRAHCLVPLLNQSLSGDTGASVGSGPVAGRGLGRNFFRSSVRHLICSLCQACCKTGLLGIVTIQFTVELLGTFVIEESAMNNYTGTIPGKPGHNVTLLKSSVTQLLADITCLPHGHGWGWTRLFTLIAILFLTQGSTQVWLRAGLWSHTHLGFNPGTIIWKLGSVAWSCPVSSSSWDNGCWQDWKLCL